MQVVSKAFYYLVDPVAELVGDPYRLNNVDFSGIYFSLEGRDIYLEDVSALGARTHQDFVNALQYNLSTLISYGVVPAGSTLTLDYTRSEVFYLSNGYSTAPVPAVVLTIGNGEGIERPGVIKPTFVNTNEESFWRAEAEISIQQDAVPTQGDDILTGSDAGEAINALGGNDYVYALGGNDILWGGPGDDYLDGGPGTDYAYYTDAKGAVTVNLAAATVSAATIGTDTLVSIERLVLKDNKIALDINDNALETLQFIGVIAPNLLNDLSARGAVLQYFDQGYSMQGLCQLALNLQFLPSDPASLAIAVYQNVLGVTPDNDTVDALSSYVNQHGDANFLATVAGLNLNIDLVGLNTSGLSYV